MRAPRLIACGLAALALSVTATACSEEETKKSDEESGAGAEQVETTPAARPEPSGALKQKPRIAKPTGRPPKQLVVKDLVKGKGATARAGSQLTVNYVGVGFSDGKEFDSSFKAGQPFEFELGAGMVIPGWDEGIAGMKVGGRRRLTIPPDKAYGAGGSPPAIGPNETLVFVVDLLGVK